jgi:predicted RNA-binding protein with TRAM domain
MNGNDRAAPVKEGEEYNVEIGGVGEKGDGIAKVKGFVLFVANVKKRDYVKIKITKVLQNVGFAEVVKQLDKSEKPKKERKFVTVSQEELEEQEYEPKENYKDTEDFGDELVEE